MRESYDSREVKERLPFLELLTRDGVELRRSGINWVASCPFHREKSASFTVHGGSPDHGHCYGCGWNGDIFKWWQDRHSVGFREALEALASMARVQGVEWGRPRVIAPPVAAPVREQRLMPSLPRMRVMKDNEVAALAKLRGLFEDGVAAACADGRVGWCVWPQYERDGEWSVLDSACGAWVVTDGSRAVAQFRRMDGGVYVTKDGAKIKAWTKGSPSWPIGAMDIGFRREVLLVEGGADMLAAYHFLDAFGRLGDVAVVAMLGASNRIGEDAIGYFEGKRVRIMMDVDEANGQTGKVPSWEAAARWTDQLTEVGAAVESYSLAGLMRKDGAAVKDLNDLALCSEEVWMDGELRDAFFDFDF